MQETGPQGMELPTPGLDTHLDENLWPLEIDQILSNLNLS